jgi:DNA-binding beta-propeller fold protein YncE
VWVSNGDGASVSRIDPTTSKVTTFPVGGRALAVGADAQGVWVLVGPDFS